MPIAPPSAVQLPAAAPHAPVGSRYVEIVAGSSGKVEQFSCGPSKISQLQAKLEVHGGCEQIPCTDVSDLLGNV